MKHLLKLMSLPAAVVACAALAPAFAAVSIDTVALRNAVTVDGVRAHQFALQGIADANQGTRVAGSPGHDASAAYVYNKLAARLAWSSSTKAIRPIASPCSAARSALRSVFR
ncbi:hypothetical protein LJR175_004256 [Variovorax sp. LjRoot175]|uniref:hypothetical protein n=1 Tax=Variovorax sp. LjRoot175 TaxID=3342276 RepID=UPI003ECE9E02